MHPKKRALLRNFRKECIAENHSSSSESESSMWLKLPDDLLELIVGRLDLVSYLRLRVVCRSWLSILMNKHNLLANEFPWLMVESSGTYSFRRLMGHQVHHLNLPQIQDNFCLGYSEGWLIMVNSKVKCSKVCLIHPFSRSQIWLPRVPWGWKFCKATLSSDPAAADPIVMVIGYGKTTLAFCRPGDRTWTTCYHQVGVGQVIDDVIFFQGKFYAFSKHGTIIVSDFTPRPNVTLLQLGEPPRLRPSYKRYLIESCGHLLLVAYRHYFAEKYIFEVLRLDMHELHWTRMESLGDCTLFLSPASSLSVSVPGHLKYPRNCIYYTDHWCRDQDAVGAWKSGVYSMDTGKITPLIGSGTCRSGLAPVWVLPRPW